MPGFYLTLHDFAQIVQVDESFPPLAHAVSDSVIQTWADSVTVSVFLTWDVHFEYALGIRSS